MNSTTAALLFAFASLALLPLSGCKKTEDPAKKPTVRAEPPAPPPAKPTPMPKQMAQPKGNVTSQSSEHVASGAPTKTETDPGQAFHGKPQMELDSKTLADVRSTIEQTCQLLEEGVELLEKNAKTPEKAAKALNAYREKNASRIQQVFKSAADVRARLRSVGYDQDIPSEVRPEFEKRMGAIQERLEKMRHTYKKHRNVLEAFGALFPRAR